MFGHFLTKLARQKGCDAVSKVSFDAASSPTKTSCPSQRELAVVGVGKHEQSKSCLPRTLLPKSTKPHRSPHKLQAAASRLKLSDASKPEGKQLSLRQLLAPFQSTGSDSYSPEPLKVK